MEDLVKEGLSLKVACVAAILRNAQGRVLLQQREDSPDVPFAGYWTLPGGKVEDGETPGDAIERELMEEIGFETSRDGSLRRDTRKIFADALPQTCSQTLHNAPQMWVKMGVLRQKTCIWGCR